MKPGYYLVGVNGAYRPQNDRYSYNYAAQISANGVVNFLQTVIEDPISAADAIDGVNANFNKDKTPDLGISEDGFTTDFSEEYPADGYVAHGPYGYRSQCRSLPELHCLRGWCRQRPDYRYC